MMNTIISEKADCFIIYRQNINGIEEISNFGW